MKCTYGSSLNDGHPLSHLFVRRWIHDRRCTSSMQSDYPIAKEASTTNVDLTTLIPVHAVLCGGCLSL